MGTHVNGPAVIVEPASLSGNPLAVIIKQGSCCAQTSFLLELPFLFKVLSVNKALSIQAHPDKALAKQLHTAHPDLYKDPNHKPEMAIALGDFEALCGFKGEGEIRRSVEEVDVLKEIVGTWSGLRDAFTKVMNGKKEHVLRHHKHLIDTGKEQSLSLEDVLFQVIYSQFPDDIGCLCVYFLNHIKLREGEALFLAANEPHAYLKGDCIEVMATSDNVVRAGLTPKHRDVATLCSMLTYKSWKREELIVRPSLQHNESKACYRVPVKEFAVDKYAFGRNGCKEVIEGGSVLIVIKGSINVDGSVLGEGAVVYVKEAIEMQSVGEGTLVFVAFQP